MKILLVDDEQDFLEIMEERIKSWGHQAICAASGMEVIDKIKDGNLDADVVVLDYKMPGMDGVATLIKMRKLGCKAPVIMFTAYPDKRSIEHSEELDVAAFIPKLSMFSDVQTALKTAIDMINKKENKKEAV